MKKVTKLSNRKTLAAAMGRDVSTLCRWLSDPGWPVKRQGPWTQSDVSTIKAWRDRVQQALADDTEIADVLATTDRGDSDSMRQAKLAVLKERAAKLRLERRQLEGKLLDADVVERGRVDRIQAVRQGMEALVHALPPRLVGLGAEGIEKELGRAFRDLCNGFAQE